MKPIVLLDLTKLTADEVAALRRDGFEVPPNIWGAPSYANRGYWLAQRSQIHQRMEHFR